MITCKNLRDFEAKIQEMLIERDLFAPLREEEEEEFCIKNRHFTTVDNKKDNCR